MDSMIPLYHSDLFVKENVGTDEQISDLKKQILDNEEIITEEFLNSWFK